MKKFIFLILLSIFITPASFGRENVPLFTLHLLKNDTREIKSLLNSQIRYANHTNLKKFISTYDKDYVNCDGLNLESYSALVKDIWETYDNIEYGLEIKDITINEDTAKVEVIEKSYADIPTADMKGVLTSNADSIYYLKKIDGKWKVSSDKILSETTSMLYGKAQELDIKLTAPKEINANTEYTASLEFVPPKDTIAIASIAMDKVEYPQKEVKEVYRKFPEDNILERLFVSNSDNANEYVVAFIGLTKPDICDLNITLTITGFAYKITRVNVIPLNNEAENVKNE